MEERKIPKQLGNYSIKKKIGKGALARVHLGVHKDLGSKQAFKFSLFSDDDKYFAEEAKVMMKLKDHPHVVTSRDCCLSAEESKEGIVWISMDYVEHGKDIHSVGDYIAKKGTFGVEESVMVVRQVLEALVYSHEQGIIHRDIKPNNILIDDVLTAYVTDFNLAKDRSDGEETFRDSLRSAGGGSSDYSSPEQKDKGNGPIDERTDVYSTALAFNKMLTGKFWLKNPCLKRTDVPQELGDLIEQAIEFEYEKRIPSAREFLERLDAIPMPGQKPNLDGVIEQYRQDVYNVLARNPKKVLEITDLGDLRAAKQILYAKMKEAGQSLPDKTVEDKIAKRYNQDEKLMRSFCAKADKVFNKGSMDEKIRHEIMDQALYYQKVNATWDKV
jgi:serine/threonine protein kinase